MNIDSLLFLFPKKTQSAVEIHCVFLFIGLHAVYSSYWCLSRSMLEKASLFYRTSLKSHRCRKGHDFPADRMLDLQAFGV